MTQAVSNIVVFVLVVSLVLLLLPQTQISSAAKKAVFFVVIVFIVSQVLSLDFDLDHWELEQSRQSVLQTMADVSRDCVQKQLDAMLNSADIPHGDIEVTVQTMENKVAITSIQVEAEEQYRPKIDAIIQTNFHIEEDSDD